MSTIFARFRHCSFSLKLDRSQLVSEEKVKRYFDEFAVTSHFTVHTLEFRPSSKRNQSN